MVQVDIDDNIYDEIKMISDKNPIYYPTIKSFVNRVLAEEIKRLKTPKTISE